MSWFLTDSLTFTFFYLKWIWKKLTLLCEGVISWMFPIGNLLIRVWETSWSSCSCGDIIWLTKQMEIILCNWSVWKDHWKPKSKNDMKILNSKLHRKQGDSWKYFMLASNASKWWETIKKCCLCSAVIENVDSYTEGVLKQVGKKDFVL